MAILEGPLYSEEARGQLTQTLVFKRGGFHPKVAGFFYHPVNWTQPKINQALAWRTLCQSWRSLDPSLKAFWSSIAPGVLTGFNYFMQHAGVPPLPPPYEPPAGNNILFNFIIFPYTPPSGSSLTISF